MTVTRRTVVGALLGSAALAAPAVLRAQTRELVMIGYGNEQDQPLVRAGQILGQRHPGVTLRVIGGLSAEALAQIKAARGNSPYDLAVMGSPAILNAVAEGVLEPLDFTKIPNAANVIPSFMPYGYNVGCPVVFEGIGIAYNRDTVKTPPATWADLWKPEFKGKVGMARPQSNLGLGVLAATAEAFGRPQDDMQFALDKWKELSPLVGRSPPLLQQMIERGEVDLAPLWHVNAALAAAAGLPIGYVKIAGPGPLMLPTNIVHFVNTAEPVRALVHEFTDILLTEEIQRMAGSAPIFFGTVRQGLDVPAEAKPYVPATAAELAQGRAAARQDCGDLRPDVRRMTMPAAGAIAPASSQASSHVVEIAGLSRRFGDLVVLDDCSLSVAEGEIVTLLGPSGCGKTTLLRCIAGFIAPERGTVRLDGRDMASVPVNRRPVGVVFQSYALFPHMTVAGNVGYGLRLRGLPKAEIARRVEATLATVSLSALADRYPAQLSGGQQQRVAVARVLVLEPRVLLLDEPFSALDAKLRGTMQVELRALIKRLGMTSIFVTHDQEEALTISDRVAVMRAGRIEQIDTPEAVFDRPATDYVADFIGASNFWAAEAAGGSVALPDGQRVATPLSGPVRVMVRPHHLSLAPGEAGPWTGTVTARHAVGPLVEHRVETAAGVSLRILAMRTEGAAAPVGARVTLRVDAPQLCAVYPGR
jgi:ABC-type Fe3+/spermidine/putrescine transport system ATPase subunit/spermidine/putrescine-binding protein